MINQKIVVYSLSAVLVSLGVVYCLVAASEYQDFKELSDIGIEGETAEKQFEMTFFTATGIVNFGLGIWVLRSRTRQLLPYLASGIISSGLIVIYVASRTVGVPIVGVEYYIGRIDVVSKILQIIAIALSGFAIYGVQKLRIVKKISR